MAGYRAETGRIFVKSVPVFLGICSSLQDELGSKVSQTLMPHVCLHFLSLFPFPSRRRPPPAMLSSCRCSWMQGSWWAASPRPSTPCSAPTCCPTSRSGAGTWRKLPASCWRQATGPRQAPCCWLIAEPTRPSSPSTLPWPFSRSGCERCRAWRGVRGGEAVWTTATDRPWWWRSFREGEREGVERAAELDWIEIWRKEREGRTEVISGCTSAFCSVIGFPVHQLRTRQQQQLQCLPLRYKSGYLLIVKHLLN